jgi:maltose alpha-D-glucosyltransferase/alpha-amylase
MQVLSRVGTTTRMRLDQVSDQWWKDAVVYCVDVRAFLDTDGDGIGDLNGVTQRLDHLAELGITCLWLMPFQPSPCRDGGYDISDYYAVDPRLGSLGDFVELVRAAGERGIKVISDLVVNHTSDEHAWFREARSSPDSPTRHWYVWRDEPSDEPKGLFFPGTETSNWAKDDPTGQYYLHRFHHFEPDLDTANPEVRDEIARIVGFWLALGVAGFRIDAVPAMLETAGLPERVANDPKEWLRNLRAFVSRRRGDAMLLGEVNVDPQQLAQYFGDHGDLLHLEFAFLLNQSVWLALARGKADALETIVRMLPQVPHDSGWATFLRNHDELTLDKLNVSQQQEVFAAFAPDGDMRLYGHGIRRRVAPMLDGDPDRLRLAWSLAFSLPGTPVLLYGDEIGLGDNLAIDDRFAVRVPMQWSAERHGGFTTADEPWRPLAGRPFGPERVNVASQRRDPDSLLRWMRRLIWSRRTRPQLGWGSVTLIDTPAPSIFAHRADWEGGTVVAVHNLAEEPAAVTLELGDDVSGVQDALGARQLEPPKDGRLDLKLGRYGYLWLDLIR